MQVMPTAKGGAASQETLPIQSLDRGLIILEVIAKANNPVSLTDLTNVLGIDRSSVFRLANTLKRRGFLAYPSGRKDYILGPALWRFLHQYDWGTMLIRVSHEHLKELADQINETAHLAIREGKHALFIDHTTANHLISVSAQTGEMVPLYCTAHGKALLADADERELRALIGPGQLRRYTKNTMTSIQELSKDCALIKKRGYATDEAEFAEDLRCVAAPIRVDNDVIVGSIGVSAPMSRFSKERHRVAAVQVCKVADAIGQLLSNADQSGDGEPEKSVIEFA
jgi:IclR family acetate operon transcriptional repressor